jgi:tetratricopeptide (TPR) repeat protein
MRNQQKFFIFGMIVVSLVLSPALKGACADTQQGKIPVSTSSEKAKNDFLQGRDFAEKLRIGDSLTYFEKAVQADPNFATAYLNLALARPSAKGFFEDLKKAVALSNKTSEGERLWILGVEAGANGLPAKQGEYYQKLVASFPNDERAHNLLGGYYLGLQQYEKAVQEFRRAVEINPNFTPAYNLLGYAYRFLAKYDESEKAFKKYIELIPDDPNPLDSYAELLLKIGRYDESIENYRKALSKDPHFFNSYLGIATDYNLKGEHQRAREELQKLYNTARDDGERRAALFAMTVSYVDAGDWQKAIAEQEKMFALARKINDSANMAGDLITIGTILVENGRAREAKAKFDQTAKIMADSNLSADVKEAARRNSIFNAATCFAW